MSLNAGLNESKKSRPLSSDNSELPLKYELLIITSRLPAKHTKPMQPIGLTEPMGQTRLMPFST